LALLGSLVECGKFSLIDFADRLLRWLDDGYMAVDGEIFDVGIQTASALNRLRGGVPPRESGGTSEWDNGNGSLMRTLPLALWHQGPDEALVRDAHLQSLPTHAHPRSLAACAFYCLTARGYSRSVADPWSWADQRLEEIYDAWSEQRERNRLLTELDALRRFPKTDQPRGTGYVLDTIWSARGRWRKIRSKTLRVPRSCSATILTRLPPSLVALLVCVSTSQEFRPDDCNSCGASRSLNR
jgi:ADP-ribosylglycohydrolase